MGDGFGDGVLGNLVEYDAAGLFRRKAEGLAEVPGDGFPFPVFIAGEPDGVGPLGQFLQFGDHFLLVGGHDVFRLETVGDVDAQLVLLQVADVADAGFDEIIVAQVALDDLAGRLYDN